MPSSNSFGDLMQRAFGEMEDDPSRRRRGRNNRRNRDGDDDLQIGCLVKNPPKTTFDDVAGNHEAKGEMVEVSKAIREPDCYSMFGARLPKGILMTGLPGVGKTYLTGALAHTLNAPFYHVKTSDITSKWFGESEKNIQKIFDHAKGYVNGQYDIENGVVTEFDLEEWADEREAELLDEFLDEEETTPVAEGQQNRRRNHRRRRINEVREQVRQEVQARQSQDEETRYAIIFFDEIDALGAARDNTPFQGGVSNRIVSVLLENMDGLESGDNIIVIASTNRPEAVDSALRRAGRFDRIIRVKKPNKEARAKCFEIHFQKAEERAEREFIQVDFEKLAEKTKGLVPADIAEIVRKTLQERAKVYRDAGEDDDMESLSLIKTQDVLKVISDYKITQRKKDPFATGKTIGFAPQKAVDEDGFILEEELSDDPEESPVEEPLIDDEPEYEEE